MYFTYFMYVPPLRILAPGAVEGRPGGSRHALVNGRLRTPTSSRTARGNLTDGGGRGCTPFQRRRGYFRGGMALIAAPCPR
jgi:hypothetical protein